LAMLGAGTRRRGAVTMGSRLGWQELDRGRRMTGFEQLLEQTPAVVGGARAAWDARSSQKVIASLAEGASDADILRAFPTLTTKHVRAAMMFAAARA
jgi:uncharacterized protein (DUF433 family)